MSRNTARNQLGLPDMNPSTSAYVAAPVMPFQNRQMKIAPLSLPIGDVAGLTTSGPGEGVRHRPTDRHLSCPARGDQIRDHQPARNHPEEREEDGPNEVAERQVAAD